MSELCQFEAHWCTICGNTLIPHNITYVHHEVLRLESKIRLNYCKTMGLSVSETVLMLSRGAIPH